MPLAFPLFSPFLSSRLSSLLAFPLFSPFLSSRLSPLRALRLSASSVLVFPPSSLHDRDAHFFRRQHSLRRDPRARRHRLPALDPPHHSPDLPAHDLLGPSLRLRRAGRWNGTAATLLRPLVGSLPARRVRRARVRPRRQALGTRPHLRLLREPSELSRYPRSLCLAARGLPHHGQSLALPFPV